MDIALLVSFLTPCLPFLVKLGDKAAEKAGEKLGEDTWGKAKAIWAKLQPKVEAKEAAKEAVADVATNPEDADSQAALRKQLAKILEGDGNLMVEISQLLAEATATAGAVQIRQTVTGDRNQVIGTLSGQAKAIGSVEGNVTL